MELREMVQANRTSLKDNREMMNSKGFTIIELMISLALFAIVSGSVYQVMLQQVYVYSINRHVTEMNQNLRGAMYMIERDILMAGYSGEVTNKNHAGLKLANANELQFTYRSDTDGIDNDNDGVTDEYGEVMTVHYFLYDSDGDGQKDDIGRTVDNDTDPDRPTAAVAENVENIEFLYTVKDAAGNEISTTDPGFDQFGHVTFVDVSILAKITKRDKNFKNTKRFTTPSGDTWGPYNDGYRRRYVTNRIFCRNIK